ncbi:methyltransferase domain-containing protein [Rhodalgimonas zhirmunskyi]|uniref:methyltransferase domain-containing protein n=1 Tax=Rhodalgimonas zhirmunskyi TaxID=2964767 RepID=UPI00295293FF|nr:methyltransferase domain-containing protein [Rhodoalgimonas zhirmunskyi]
MLAKQFACDQTSGPRLRLRGRHSRGANETVAFARQGSKFIEFTKWGKAVSKSEWNPTAYGRFRDLRLRPAIDLIRGITAWNGGDIVDLGCGAGNVGQFLRDAFSPDRVMGVDSSASMLKKAREAEVFDALFEADISTWEPPAPVGMIFSNAALQWVPDHRKLLPKLVEMLAVGGVLAVQMPCQNNAPSHRVWRSLVEEMFPGRVDPKAGPAVLEAAAYFHLLEPLGKLSLWETEYYQILEPSDNDHPVRKFTEATVARPILDALDAGERTALIAEYEAVMEKAYPRVEGGHVLFPFRRLFFTVNR